MSIYRRALELGGGALIFLSITGALTMGSRALGRQEVTKNIGTLVSLGVSDSYRLPGSNSQVTFSGMPDYDRAMLTHQTGQSSQPLYFPRDARNITIAQHQFAVVQSTPEQLVLRYMGIKQ